MTYPDLVVRALRHTNDFAEALIAAELAMQMQSTSPAAAAPPAPLNADEATASPPPPGDVLEALLGLELGFVKLKDGDSGWAGKTPPNSENWYVAYKGPDGGTFWKAKPEAQQAEVVQEQKAKQAQQKRQDAQPAKTVQPQQPTEPPQAAAQKPKTATTPAHVQAVSKLVSESLEETGSLSPEQKKQYQTAAERVMKAMPEIAGRRLQRHLKKASFFATTEGLGENYLAELEASDPDSDFTKKIKAHVERGGRVGGTFNIQTGEFRGDGAIETGGVKAAGEGGGGASVDGPYAHEFTHAIDGPNYQMSNSKEWKDIWTEEFSGGRLTNYAATSFFEGFAEFGRALYTGAADEETLNAFFPKASKFFQKYGLMHTPVQKG